MVIGASTGLASKFGVARGARTWNQVVCALFGHDVDGISWQTSGAGCRRCGAHFLPASECESRISHTVSCFLCGHAYHRIGTRDGHNEYTCVRCGHPLLFAIACDPYRELLAFTKKVRYFCNLFGHEVHQVSTRGSLIEYACDCGHAFLKRQVGMTIVKHPLICLLAGHFLHFFEVRNGYAEFHCRNCGHTFCFKEKQ